MSVPSYKRTPTKLEAILKARDLAAYTIQVCSNEKSFPPQYHTLLTQNLVDLARGIYLDCWEANNIRVSGKLAKEKFIERDQLARRAIRKCNLLIASIELGLKVYHLRASRVEYWVRITVEVREQIRAWQESFYEEHKDLLQ